MPKELSELETDEYKELSAKDIFEKHNHSGVAAEDLCKCAACRDYLSKGSKPATMKKGELQ